MKTEDSRGVAPLLIDAHVHFHDCFDRVTFFNSAAGNFKLGALQLNLAPPYTGCLLLTESAGQNRFAELHEACDREPDGPWRFAATDEDSSLAAHHGEDRIWVVAGRQIATREGLEVLALGTTHTFPDGQGLADTIEMTRENGALPVIPWGFGKWWLGRGRLVRGTIESARPGEMFLGDNSGRLRFGRRPAMFDWAAARDVLVLPGSDPLPFPSQAGKPGSYGFVLRCEVDESRPAASIKDHLRAQMEQPAIYGRLERFGSFLRNQVAMQLVKRRRRKA